MTITAQPFFFPNVQDNTYKNVSHKWISRHKKVSEVRQPVTVLRGFQDGVFRLFTFIMGPHLPVNSMSLVPPASANSSMGFSILS